MRDSEFCIVSRKNVEQMSQCREWCVSLPILFHSIIQNHSAMSLYNLFRHKVLVNKWRNLPCFPSLSINPHNEIESSANPRGNFDGHVTLTKTATHDLRIASSPAGPLVDCMDTVNRPGACIKRYGRTYSAQKSEWLRHRLFSQESVTYFWCVATKIVVSFSWTCRHQEYEKNQWYQTRRHDFRHVATAVRFEGARHLSVPS
jgi:hypothetical protein